MNIDKQEHLPPISLTQEMISSQNEAKISRIQINQKIMDGGSTPPLFDFRVYHKSYKNKAH